MAVWVPWPRWWHFPRDLGETTTVWRVPVRCQIFKAGLETETWNQKQAERRRECNHGSEHLLSHFWGQRIEYDFSWKLRLEGQNQNAKEKTETSHQAQQSKSKTRHQRLSILCQRTCKGNERQEVEVWSQFQHGGRFTVEVAQYGRAQAIWTDDRWVRYGCQAPKDGQRW